MGVAFSRMPDMAPVFGFPPGMFPVAEAAGESFVSLPLRPGLRDSDPGRVVLACELALEMTS